MGERGKWRVRQGMVVPPGRCAFIDGKQATERCTIRFYSGYVATYEYCAEHAVAVASGPKGDNIAQRFFGAVR